MSLYYYVMRHIVHTIARSKHIARIRSHKHFHHAKKLQWMIEGVLIVVALSVLGGFAMRHQSQLEGSVVPQRSIYRATSPHIVCTNGYSVTPTYYTNSATNTSGVLERLSLRVSYKNATTTYDMRQALSGSGSRFANTGESVVFWEHKGEFSLSFSGAELSLCVPYVDKAAALQNLTYTISDVDFPMVDGTAQVSLGVTDMLSLSLSLFGEPVFADFNGDGREDSAYMLVYNGGGSGSFYYAVFAMQDLFGEYVPTNMILLGDRIAPQHVELSDGGAYFMYAERATGESFTTPPSIARSLFVAYNKVTRTIESQNIPYVKKYDVTTMRLEDKKWMLASLVSEKGKVTLPRASSTYSIVFDKGNQIHITTACNVVSATYELSGDYMQISGLAGMDDFCNGINEAEFNRSMKSIMHYGFTDDGALHLYFANKKGELIFK